MKKFVMVMLICMMALFAACAGNTTRYTVTFDGNGHEIAIAAQTVEEGGRASRPSDPTAEGLTFGGWYENAACEGEEYDFSSPVTGDLTLYASWSKPAQEIATVQQFLSMREGNYLLVNDLDFAGTPFSPIGSKKAPFTGTLDGAGHEVKNVQGTAPLFGYVTGSIKNLIADVDMTISSADSTVYAGGLVGVLDGGSVQGCVVNAEIAVDVSLDLLSVYAGGVVARNFAGKVEGCIANAEVAAKNIAEVYAGGVVGYNGGEGEVNTVIASCAHYGNVKAEAGHDMAAAYAGGVVGYNGGEVRDSFASSKLVHAVSGDYYSYSGGVAGDNNGGALVRCFATADVTATTRSGDTFLGGVTGRNFLDYTMLNCYGWDGQLITLEQTGEILPTARQLRVPALPVSAAQLNDITWQRAIGLSGWILTEGMLPTQPLVQARSFARAASYGTAGAPIPVSNAEELLAMRFDRAYILTADITLSGAAAIGSYENPFCGTLLGGGHTITIESALGENGYFGLFGYLNGRVSGLNVRFTATMNEAVQAQRYAGAIAGYGQSAIITDCTAEVSIDLNAKGAIAGGIAGYLESGFVQGCSVSGSIAVRSSNPSAYAGGIVGIMSAGGSLRECANEASVRSHGEAGCMAAGLVAKSEARIEDAYNRGNVTAECSTASGNVYAGGLVARNLGTLQNVYSNASVAGSGGAVAARGTVAGANEGSIQNAYAEKTQALGTLGYSPALTRTYAIEHEEFSTLAARLNGDRAVWKDGGGGYPVLACMEA